MEPTGTPSLRVAAGSVWDETAAVEYYRHGGVGGGVGGGQPGAVNVAHLARQAEAAPGEAERARDDGGEDEQEERAEEKLVREAEVSAAEAT